MGGSPYPGAAVSRRSRWPTTEGQRAGRASDTGIEKITRAFRNGRLSREPSPQGRRDAVSSRTLHLGRHTERPISAGPRRVVPARGNNLPKGTEGVCTRLPVEAVAVRRVRRGADCARRRDSLDLVSRVRHEINNPLTGVLGQSQLLLREELNEKARKRAQTIEQLARRLAEIVAELRQVQRPARLRDADLPPHED